MRRMSVLMLVVAILYFATFNSQEYLILILNLLLGSFAVALSGWLLRKRSTS